MALIAGRGTGFLPSPHDYSPGVVAQAPFPARPPWSNREFEQVAFKLSLAGHLSNSLSSIGASCRNGGAPEARSSRSAEVKTCSRGRSEWTGYFRANLTTIRHQPRRPREIPGAIEFFGAKRTLVEPEDRAGRASSAGHEHQGRNSGCFLGRHGLVPQRLTTVGLPRAAVVRSYPFTVLPFAAKPNQYENADISRSDCLFV